MISTVNIALHTAHEAKSVTYVEGYCKQEQQQNRLIELTFLSFPLSQNFNVIRCPAERHLQYYGIKYNTSSIMTQYV
jgi:hypothetical protein